ncbi:hypothetical protein PL81_38505 [Streptomyces sp. RSD-27]|nr:hypothetical protein PL81_38505 [Streptomyces sp. RSD-27]
MTSMTSMSVTRSVALAARVTTLLADRFPEHVPGGQDGFRVESLDHQEPRRMFVRWYGGEPTRPAASSEQSFGVEGEYADVAAVLTKEGYAVARTPGRLEVFVDDRPVDSSGARYEVTANDVPFMAPWLVVDRWTRVPVASAQTESEATGEAHKLERAHVLTDARLATLPALWPFLTRADALLGDGVTWLRQELHDSRSSGELVERERLDALVDVANVLRRGEGVVQDGRSTAYDSTYPGRAHWPLTYRVRWVPKSAAPAVGYFPGRDWQRGPAEDAVITLLVDGGLRPVVYGESLGRNGFMCERDGFMVSAVNPGDLSVPGISISSIGPSVQVDRVPDVLRAAGWRVEGGGEKDWPGDWTVFPPAAG